VDASTSPSARRAPWVFYSIASAIYPFRQRVQMLVAHGARADDLDHSGQSARELEKAKKLLQGAAKRKDAMGKGK
jgi:hypothetical protein